jgi:hypothetical protein
MLAYMIHLFTFQDSKNTISAAVVINVVDAVISPVIFVVLLIAYGDVTCTTGVMKNGAEAGVRQEGVCRVGPPTVV